MKALHGTQWDGEKWIPTHSVSCAGAAWPLHLGNSLVNKRDLQEYLAQEAKSPEEVPTLRESVWALVFPLAVGGPISSSRGESGPLNLLRQIQKAPLVESSVRVSGWVVYQGAQRLSLWINPLCNSLWILLGQNREGEFLLEQHLLKCFLRTLIPHMFLERKTWLCDQEGRISAAF